MKEQPGDGFVPENVGLRSSHQVQKDGAGMEQGCDAGTILCKDEKVPLSWTEYLHSSAAASHSSAAASKDFMENVERIPVQERDV